MIRILPVVFFLTVILAACDSYTALFTGPPECVWEGTACHSDLDCCSNWCASRVCEIRP
jgi:hypothetical protein